MGFSFVTLRTKILELQQVSEKGQLLSSKVWFQSENKSFQSKGTVANAKGMALMQQGSKNTTQDATVCRRVA